MADEPDRSICIGDGSALSLGTLARFDLDPNTYKLLSQAIEDQGEDPRERLLARLTPGELVYMVYTCLHPEETDQEVMTALGLRESTFLAYYIHLDRNFHIRTSSDLRRWAFKNNLVRTPDDGSAMDLPKEDPPEDDGQDKRFDPWVRWY